uniref:Uncharacterized protein n=1 Tax=Meloidogyne enterolobii TaxID=390850 RepID=A0A6V7XVB1_MELEN|nr:unnamed protein product [Meloidogyne enterolobii]
MDKKFLVDLKSSLKIYEININNFLKIVIFVKDFVKDCYFIKDCYLTKMIPCVLFLEYLLHEYYVIINFCKCFLPLKYSDFHLKILLTISCSFG